MKDRIIRLIKVLRRKPEIHIILEFKLGNFLYEGLSLTDDLRDYMIFYSVFEKNDSEQDELSFMWKSSSQLTEEEEGQIVNMLEQILITP